MIENRNNWNAALIPIPMDTNILSVICTMSMSSPLLIFNLCWISVQKKQKDNISFLLFFLPYLIANSIITQFFLLFCIHLLTPIFRKRKIYIKPDRLTDLFYKIINTCNLNFICMTILTKHINQNILQTISSNLLYLSIHFLIITCCRNKKIQQYQYYDY